MQAQQGGTGTGTGGGQAVLDELEDLLTEVQLLSTLRHDNIVSYLSSGVTAGLVLIVMEYVSGGSLQGVLEQFGKLPLSSIKRYVKDICRGLQFLHENDPVIIHRDFKPGNVLLMIDGQCKLADFGASANMAKITGGKSKVVGTPLYMAPEACTGSVKTASDIWGVGITVHQMLAGNVPYIFTEELPFEPLRFMFQLGRLDEHPAAAPQINTALITDATALAFVNQTLKHDPEGRPSAEHCLIHTFLS